MAISFPSSPSNGQKFTSGNKVWTWDGNSWKGGVSSGGDAGTLDSLNSTQFLRSDADDGTTGKLGIGTTSPGADLHVYTPSAATAFIRIGSASAEAGINFDEGTTNKFQFRYRPSGDRFDLYNTTLGSNVMSFKDSNGNVGIGITNPSYLLHADANVGTDPSYIVAGSGSNFVMAMGSQNSPGVAQEAFIGTLSDERFKVKVNNVEKATFTSTGFGIGTTDPNAKLDVTSSRTTAYSEQSDQRGLAHIIARNSSDASGRFASISLVSGGGTQAEGSVNLVQTGNYVGDLTFKLRAGAGSADWRERMRITQGGRVGIRTSSPIATLDIASSATENALAVNAGTITFRNSSGHYTEKIQGESHALGIYGYNKNDGFLFYGNANDGGFAGDYRPAYHFGGYNNANTENHSLGWADGDAIFTMAVMNGGKTSGGVASSRGLSTSGNYTNIVKTTANTQFYDAQGQHRFMANLTANHTLASEGDPGYWYKKNTGANQGTLGRAVVLNDGQIIFRGHTDYYHKMWYADGINVGTNQGHGHFRVFGESNTSRGNGDNGATHRFSVDTSSGHIGVSEGGTQIYNNSDERLKTNIVDLPDGALTVVNALRPVTYDWRYKDQNDKPYGFIAQEVQAVDDELVFTNGPTMYREDKTYGEGLEPDGTIEDTLGINERKLLPIYAKAIQELSDLVEQLQARIAALEE